MRQPDFDAPATPKDDGLLGANEFVTPAALGQHAAKKPKGAGAPVKMNGAAGGGDGKAAAAAGSSGGGESDGGDPDKTGPKDDEDDALHLPMSTASVNYLLNGDQGYGPPSSLPRGL